MRISELGIMDGQTIEVIKDIKNNNINQEKNNFDLSNDKSYSDNNSLEDETNIQYNNLNLKQIINIRFESSSNGLRIIMPINKNDTLSDLFKLYTKKIGINEDIGKNLVYLFSGQKIVLYNKHRKIKEIFANGAVITVIEQGGIIGA